MKNVKSILILGGILIIVFLVSYLNRTKSMDSRSKASSTETEASLPTGFPKIPIYPGTKIKIMTIGSESGEGYRGEWESERSVVEVAEWYGGHLEEIGWIIDVPVADTKNEVVQYMAAKREPLILQLSIYKSNDTGKTTIEARFLVVKKDK